MSPIYLDNAATTRVAPDVARAVCESMTADYGNPASAHAFGVVAERHVADAAQTLSTAIGDEDLDQGTLLWTSGGTESDALGAIGAARARAKSRRRIVVSAIEHSAILESAKLLEETDAFEVVRVPVDGSGHIDPDQFAEACRGAAVACLMLVNNEIGAIAPVAKAARAAKAIEPDVHVHCDAVQALGKIPIDAPGLAADSIAFAAHKLHGPKGVGALWLRKGARITPLWRGGGQQHGLRSGTINVPGIVGFGAATRLAMASIGEHESRWRGYANTLIEAAERSGRLRAINGGEPRAPHILSLAFDRIPAEPLLHVLESRGVLVSAGSACSERKRRASHVLEAIGTGASDGVLRISFGRFTTADDITRAAEILEESLRAF